MLGHGKPSYRTRELPRKNFVSKPRRHAIASNRRKLPKITLSKTAMRSQFGERYSATEFGNHNSVNGPELSLVFCGRTLIFSQRFQTTRRSVWYKW
jgi:hypothetical protein